MFIDVFTLRNENDMKTITSQEEVYYPRKS